MDRSTSKPTEIAAAKREDLPQALELIFDQVPSADRHRRKKTLLDMLSGDTRGAIEVFVLRSAQGVSGAIVCELLPGRTGVVWPPRLAHGPARESDEDGL